MFTKYVYMALKNKRKLNCIESTCFVAKKHFTLHIPINQVNVALKHFKPDLARETIKYLKRLRKLDKFLQKQGQLK